MTPEEMPSAGEAWPAGQPMPSTNNASKQKYQLNCPAFKKPVTKTQTTHFGGKCDDLNGSTYDCSDPQQAANIYYTKTTKEIVEYVCRTYKYGANIRLAVETLVLPTFTKPSDPPTEATRTQVRMWEKLVDKFIKEETHLEENIKTTYSLILRQCIEAMRAKLESKPNHQIIAAASNGIKLMKNIKSVMFISFQSQKYRHAALHESKIQLCLLKQDKQMMVQIYLDRFQNSVKVIDHYVAR
jgi:hypothetical protein